MAANITLPLDIRATLTNDTRRGAKQVIDETKALRIQLQKEMDFSGSAPTSGGTAADLIRKASAGIDHQEATASLRKLQAKKRYEDQKERDRDDEDFRNFLQDQKRERERIEREQRQQAVEQSRSVYEAREAIADTHAERMAQTEEQAGRESAARRIRIEREAAKQKAEIDQRLLESGDKSKEAATKARAQKDLIDLKTRRRLAEEAHAGGGAGHGTRIFSDASTTGLDPLQRFLGGALGDKLGMGVGILGGAVVTKSLADATQKGVEFANIIRQGKLDASGLVIEFGKSIPILGNIVEAGQNIREIMTGERMELERQQHVIESINDLQKIGLSTALQAAESRRKEAFSLHMMSLELEGIGKRGNPATEHAIRMKEEAAVEAANKKEIAARNARLNDPEVEAARKKVLDFDRQFGERMADLAAAEEDPKVKRLKRVVQNNPRLRDSNRVPETEYDKLKAERERLVQEVRKIEADKGKLYKGQEESAKQQGAAGQKIGKKELAENTRIYNEQRKIDLARAASDRKSIEDETTRMSLENIGLRKDAALAAIKAQMEAEIRASELAEREAILQTTDQQKISEIKQQEADKRTAIAKRAAQEEARTTRDFALQRKQAEFEAVEAGKAATLAAEQEKMRAMGRGGEAEIALLNAEAERKKRSIDQQLKAKLATDKTNEKEDKAKAEEEKKAVDAQLQTAIRRQYESNRQRFAGVEMSLGQQGLTSLKGAAGMGDFRAAAQVMTEEIKLQFQSRRNELLSTIGDENATAVQKRRAQEMLAGLDKEQRLAITTAGMSTAAGMPSVVGAGRTSGAAQRFAEANSPFIRMIRLQESAIEVAKRQAKASEETNRLLADSPVMKAALAGRR